MTNEAKKRGKYGRPCDRCAARRVRCVPGPDTSCKGCASLGVECTHCRVRKKAGPKTGSTRAARSWQYAEGTPAGSAGPPRSGMRSYGARTVADEAIQLPTMNASQMTGLGLGTAPFAASTEDMAVPTPRRQGLDPGTSADALAAFQLPTSPHMARLTVQNLLSALQVYQTWFYGCWPVLSVADLISNISGGAQMGFGEDYVELTEKNAMAYALACAVCAAITTQLSFVSSKNGDSVPGVTAKEFAEEARRVRNLFDYTAEPSVNTLLSSFFLYCHHINNKGRVQQAIVYLREAICIAQILGFHDPSCYKGKTRAEVHRWRKIYYTLVVTERYTGFEDAMPVVLDPCIKFPDLADEEYPSLLHGFLELVRVFSVPSKNFFLDINTNEGVQTGNAVREGILSVQKKLDPPREFSPDVTTSQRLNVVLSKSWIRAIAWRLTSNSGMVQPQKGSDDRFSYNFPLRNARDFLTQTQNFPDLAYETNGPGVCIKLLELAKSLTFSFEKLGNQMAGLTVLESLFSLVNRFKNDVTFPMNTYREVAGTIADAKLRHIPYSISTPVMYQGATVEELREDEGGSTVEDVFGGKVPIAPTVPAGFAEYDRNYNADLASMCCMRYASEESPSFESPNPNSRLFTFTTNRANGIGFGSNTFLSSLLDTNVSQPLQD